MQKALVGLLISLGFLVPVLASAHSAPKPPKDTTPPSVTSIHIQSNNANPARAKAGDTVTITFTASEKVTPVVLAETKTLFVRATNTAGNSWSASYVVDARDATGSVDYLLAMADTSNNAFVCSSVRIPFVAYCPTTDGSLVTIYKDATPPPPPPADTQAPVIDAHADVYATTTDNAPLAVSYTTPGATDNVDTSVAVSCTPASGSLFTLGTTTITCTAHDAAGNNSASTFNVIVAQETIIVPPPLPSPYSMAGQTDESYLCGVANQSWRFCDDAGTFGFTDAPDSGVATIDLGQGSSMGTGTLQTVTIAKDPTSAFNLFHPWLITISCFTDSSHTNACADWSAVSDSANESADGTHWNADFSALARTFNQAEYYVMTIDDTNWETAAYGSQSPAKPYWVITGLR